MKDIRKEEPAHRIENDRKIFDVTVTTDAVRRPRKGQENESQDTAIPHRER